MKKEVKILILGLIIILLLTLSCINLFIPKIYIELNGNQLITLNIGEKYVEYGANASIKNIFQNQKIEVAVNGKVLNEIGKYEITYVAKYNNYQKKAVRIVNVIDSEKPIIKLNKEVVACKKNNLVEIDATVIDNVDGNLTTELKYKIKGEKIEISAIDSSNNIATLSSKIKYIDSEKPEIILNGAEELSIQTGDMYIEYGFQAFDSCDGNITNSVNIEGSVDTNTEGIYELIYIVKDSNNNQAKKTRKIIVTNENCNQKVQNGVIYLTFDDGPGPYTQQFLDVLAKYNVKATFFVTGQFPKYENLIKSEYANGHAIGIHTYSHKWSIYSSVDAYLDDFTKISNIVYNQIGIYPKIFRFPGGSSNTVSKMYSEGIMSNLTKLMEEKGYIYFDWTFDSGDTSKKNNSPEDIVRNVKANLKGDGTYIILMHDIKKNTLEALPIIIEYAQGLGYTFETINENTPIKHFKIAN